MVNTDIENLIIINIINTFFVVLVFIVSSTFPFIKFKSWQTLLYQVGHYILYIINGIFVLLQQNNKGNFWIGFVVFGIVQILYCGGFTIYSVIQDD